MMARVACVIEATELRDGERMMDSIIATCHRCFHETRSFGQGGPSIRRCLALMKNECPNGEANFYYHQGISDV